VILAQQRLPLIDCEDRVSSGAEGLSTHGGGSGADCQQGADTKAFKGKGGSSRLNRLQAERVSRLQAAVQEKLVKLVAVQTDMQQLAAETKAVAIREFFLEVHRRGQTGQTSLRWRLVPGGWRHVKWEDQALQVALTRLALVWQGWYVEANTQAQKLNREERELRAYLRDEGHRGVSVSTHMTKVRHD